MKLSQTNGPILHFYDGDLHSSLLHLKNAGFKYVDISFFTQYLPGSSYFTTDNEVLAEQYRRELETLELIPVQSHEPSGNSMGGDGGRYYFKKTPLAIDLAGKIGIPSITLHTGEPATLMSREEYIEKQAEIFKQLIPYAEKYGTELLVENISFEVGGRHLATADDLNEVLDRIDHPLFGACWDTGHGNLNKQNLYETIITLGDKLMALHVHDNCAYFEPSYRHHRIDMHTTPFATQYASVNYDALLQGLVDIGYKGTFNFEVLTMTRSIRPAFTYNGEVVRTLEKPPIFLWKQAQTLLYNTGKYMLECYGLFEG